MDLHLFKHWTTKLLTPGTFVRENYASFKELLEQDRRSHELIAELEAIYYNHRQVDIKFIERRYNELTGAVATIINALIRMAPGPYDNLRDYFQKIDNYGRYIFTAARRKKEMPLTMPLTSVGVDDRQITGDKAFNLAMLANGLQMPVPAGFVISTDAFHAFLDHNDLQGEIDRRLAVLDISDPQDLRQIADEINALIAAATVPPSLASSMTTAFSNLQEQQGDAIRVAMRSSAGLEDSATSFAGQYHTELHVDRHALLAAYKRVLAGKYSARALYYRINRGIADCDTPMAVLVLIMVDARAGGVIYTADPTNATDPSLTIHSIRGLGELLVAGEVSPDVIQLTRSPSLHISGRHLAVTTRDMAEELPSTGLLDSGPQPRPQGASLNDAAALELGRLAVAIEQFYGEPQDIEWCQGRDGTLTILQARALCREKGARQAEPQSGVEIKAPILFQGGECASSGLAGGRLFFLDSEQQLDQVEAGSILVTRNTPPAYVRTTDRIVALISEQGSVAGHFASVARELGLPVIVNTGPALRRLRHGAEVTICAHTATIYEGMIKLPARAAPVEADTPFRRKLKYILGFVSPLTLIDTQALNFNPEGCRSLHDIIRLCHEKGMQEMFATGDRWGTRVHGAKKIISAIPMTVYVLDVDKGLVDAARNMEEISLSEIHCLAMHALWAGLSHPDIDWSQQSHFDWKSFDDLALAGGIASKNADAVASYAIISHDYLNLNMRFGYHFTVLDTLCGPEANDNYIILRFAGGGGNFTGRAMRVEFLSRVLVRLGFSVESKGDLIDARLSHQEHDLIKDKLNMVGRLLGVTRLLDMTLNNEEMVEEYLADFFAENYHFAAQKNM